MLQVTPPKPSSSDIPSILSKPSDSDTPETPEQDLNVIFADVEEKDWFHDAVTYVHENGMMNGTDTTTFDPDGITTRGMIVTILWRLEGSLAEDGDKKAFADVEDDKYYTDAVAWASSNNIVDGYGDGRFGPNDPISREQMAAVLWRYAGYKDYDLSKHTDILGFDDVSQVNSYAM